MKSTEREIGRNFFVNAVDCPKQWKITFLFSFACFNTWTWVLLVIVDCLYIFVLWLYTFYYIIFFVRGLKVLVAICVFFKLKNKKRKWNEREKTSWLMLCNIFYWMGKISRWTKAILSGNLVNWNFYSFSTETCSVIFGKFSWVFLLLLENILFN